MKLLQNPKQMKKKLIFGKNKEQQSGVIPNTT